MTIIQRGVTIAESTGQVYDFQEGAPSPTDRGPATEAAPFIAVIERLKTRVRSAKLKDHDEVLEDLQTWIDRALRGEMNVTRDGDTISETLSTNVDEMISSRTAWAAANPTRRLIVKARTRLIRIPPHSVHW